MKPKDKIYYLRLACAVAVGVINGAFWLYDIRGLIFFIFVLIASHYAAIYLLYVNPEELGGQWKVFTTGLFSYIFLGIVVWTLMFNVISTPFIFPGGISLP